MIKDCILNMRIEGGIRLTADGSRRTNFEVKTSEVKELRRQNGRLERLPADSRSIESTYAVSQFADWSVRGIIYSEVKMLLQVWITKSL